MNNLFRMLIVILLLTNILDINASMPNIYEERFGTYPALSKSISLEKFSNINKPLTAIQTTYQAEGTLFDY